MLRFKFETAFPKYNINIMIQFSKGIILMTKRAAKSGITLDLNEVSIVKGMIARGDRQHDIAAWFGVNGGRIADIATGK